MEGILARDESGKDICLVIEKICFSLDHTSGIGRGSKKDPRGIQMNRSVRPLLTWRAIQ
jgi:hypothetical protein